MSAGMAMLNRQVREQNGVGAGLMFNPVRLSRDDQPEPEQMLDGIDRAAAQIRTSASGASTQKIPGLTLMRLRAVMVRVSQ